MSIDQCRAVRDQINNARLNDVVPVCALNFLLKIRSEDQILKLFVYLRNTILDDTIHCVKPKYTIPR